MDKHPMIRNWMISIAVILLIITMGITINGRERLTFAENLLGNIVKPVQTGLTHFSNFIAEKTYPIRNVFKISNENEALRLALIETQQKLIYQTMLQEEYNDLKSLRKALNYAYRNNLNNYITADIIARDAGNWYSMFTLNVGLEDGVGENAMVFNGGGLIGQVFDVGDNWSKALTITDVRGNVSFQVVDDVRNYDGVVSGVSETELSGYLFDPDAVVEIGDQIITSGLGIYPKGVIIGNITEVIKDKDTLLKHIKVKPNVDFKRIDRVLVIPEVNTITE